MDVGRGCLVFDKQYDLGLDGLQTTGVALRSAVLVLYSIGLCWSLSMVTEASVMSQKTQEKGHAPQRYGDKSSTKKSVSVAQYILDQCREAGYGAITLQQIIKLVYIAHGLIEAPQLFPASR